MIIYKTILPILLLITLQACGRVGNHEHKKLIQVEYEKITNPIAKEAIKAWQAGDRAKWLSLFTENPILLDDGSSINFLKFSDYITQNRKKQGHC